MKKSSSAVVFTVLIIALAGAIYFGRSYTLKKNDGNISSIQSTDKEEITEENNEDIAFGEYIHTIPDGEKITVRYLNSAGVTRIYSIYPVETKNRYDISNSGGMAVYRANDGHIWLFYNNGTMKKLTPDKYGSIDKKSIEEQASGYIWADELEFLDDENIMFVSDLPGTSNLPIKSIWQVHIGDGNMKKIYTPTSNEYKILGHREDNRLLILDGEKIVAVNRERDMFDTIDIFGKHIISLSPDGTKIIYAKKDGNNEPVLSSLYMMDSWGNKPTVLPKIHGYTPTDMGAWSDDSLKYGFVIKGDSGQDRIGVIVFEEGHTDITHYSPETIIDFPNDSELKWTSESSLSVDIGEDVVTVDFE